MGRGSSFHHYNWDNYKIVPWFIHFLQLLTLVFTSANLTLNIKNFCKLLPSVTWNYLITLNEILTQNKITLTVLLNIPICRNPLFFFFFFFTHPHRQKPTHPDKPLLLLLRPLGSLSTATSTTPTLYTPWKWHWILVTWQCSLYDN